MIGLCKKLNIIYIFTCNPENPQTNGPQWCQVHELIIFLNQFFWIRLKQFVTRAEISLYLILWWLNWLRASVPPTVTELRKKFDLDRRLIWACVNRAFEMKRRNECFYGFSLFMLRLVYSLYMLYVFLHRPIVSLHKTSTYRQEPWVLILCCLYVFWILNVTVALY